MARCLKNTDAYDMGVEVKLYVQHSVQYRCADVFKANHIDMEKDVIIFHEIAPGLGREIWSKFGKKNRSYYHFMFSEYQRIVCFDADMWFIDHPAFFRSLSELPTDMIAYADLYEQRTASLKNRIEQFTQLNGLNIDEIFEIAGITDLPGTLQTPLGYLWTHPGEALLDDMAHFDFVRWIGDYSAYIGHDEECMALASHKFSYPFHSLKAVAGIDCVRVRDVMSETIKGAKIAHGKAPHKEDTDFNAFLSNL